MEIQKPISNTPMILGIIGGIIGLPAALCSGACAAAITSIGNNTNAEDVSHAGKIFMWIGLIGAILGFVSAFMYKKNPGTWGIMMLLAGILSLLNLITMNATALIPATLFIIGGAIALAQKKRIIVITP